MLKGFQKIIEERIRKAQEEGEFENLPGSGKPLSMDEPNVPDELRLAYKILKNAECLPPEIELKKEITQVEDILSGMTDTAERYRILKKLNFLILKLNLSRGGSVRFEMPQHYEAKLAAHMDTRKTPCQK
ncbi:MAG: DUF1992 domain-containing protein [Desulfobacterales bacterium]|nr:DUF1992 domain-containing protein [Desulfobacterales bacterium]